MFDSALCIFSSFSM